MREDAGPADWWTVLVGITALLVAGACGVVLWSVVPLVSYAYYALAIVVLAVLGAVWLILSVIGWFKFRAMRWSLIAPGLVLVTGALVMLSVPSRVAFMASQSSLVAEAQECSTSSTDRRIGAYQVRRIEPVGDGCLFYLEGGLINSIGLAYLPDGAPYLGDPRHDGDIGYQAFDGDWYTFVQAF
ncbi:hypothetical protein ACFRFQ_09220 [Rhodococcus sp. NPDC056743]|uniref:hypothetical protein n=1 Tax=Rhodococcus sp. NPDC056743 TaxID=3345934 RepID=UPI0036720995